MSRVSAGLLMYRQQAARVDVLLVHPGGPFFKNKDEGAWSIPKGEVEPGEELLAAARREFTEELGLIPTGSFLPLTSIKQRGGKTVHAWAFRGDCDPTSIHSNLVTIEWPPRSGRHVEFPEVDRADFFGIDQALLKVNSAQRPLILQLVEAITGSKPASESG